MKVELAGMLSSVLIARQMERKGDWFMGYWVVCFPIM
jgi:hypothetical protein